MFTICRWHRQAKIRTWWRSKLAKYSTWGPNELPSISRRAKRRRAEIRTAKKPKKENNRYVSSERASLAWGDLGTIWLIYHDLLRDGQPINALSYIQIRRCLSHFACCVLPPRIMTAKNDFFGGYARMLKLQGAVSAELHANQLVRQPWPLYFLLVWLVKV